MRTIAERMPASRLSSSEVKQQLVQHTTEAYAEALAPVWHGLAVTLARAEELAVTRPALAEPGAAGRLSALQYRLHLAAETVADVAPPEGTEEAHRELADALADGRDATARVIRELEHEGVATSLYEWRGALFRIRLAREELRHAKEPVTKAFPWRELQGIALLLAAAVALAIGTDASAWVVVAAAVVALPLAISLLLRP